MNRNTRRPVLLDADGLFGYAMKMLGGRALSMGEVREKLRRKAADPNDIPNVVAKLKEYGYLDDKKMAENYAAARRDSRGFGKARVVRDLQQRRVAPGLVKEVADEAFAGVDEAAMIEDFLERKYRGQPLPQLLSDEKKLASVFRRLRTAGFSSGTSIRVLKRHAARAEELESMDEPDTAE